MNEANQFDHNDEAADNDAIFGGNGPLPPGNEPLRQENEALGEENEARPEENEALHEQILNVLRNVVDPELGINIVDLGLVYGLDIQGDSVHITYTLTTMGCPIGPMIEAEMKQFLSGVEGVRDVEAEMVLRPPWTPEMMSDEAKAALGFF
jgi:metal-sulfur cluster biosynthetic enzyme